MEDTEMEQPQNEIQRYLKGYQSRVAQYGRRLDIFMATTTPRKKYITELLLRIPLMFAIHQWYLLSPNSEYRILEVFLFILRQLGAFIMFGCWALSNGKLVILYASLFIDIVIGWSVHICYWMFQNEAYGKCQIDAWVCWGDIDDPWWIPSVGILFMQLLYFCYLHQKYGLRQDLGYESIWLGLAALTPHVICTFGMCLYWIAPIHYWVSKIIFCMCFFGQILEQFANDPTNALGNRRLPPVPGRWFTRDLFALFGLLYFVIAVFIDGVFRVNIAQIATVTYITSYIGDWCTSLFIVMSLASMFAMLSNAAVAFSRYFVMGKTDLVEVFDGNIGNRAAIGMTIFCLEAGLLSVDREVRIENMKSVIFLTFYVIICQAWDMTEQYFLFVINRGEMQKWYAYVRIILFSIFIITLPSITTYYTSAWLQIDLWLLLHASGNFSLLVRAFLSLVEVCLVSTAWYADDRLELLENAISCVRTVKSFGSLVCIVLLSYYRLMSPFFDGFWLFRVTIIIGDAVLLCIMMLYKEWVNFQKRRSLLSKLGSISDASQEQIANMEDVCAICFSDILSGKQLHCKHIFHENCLRKWFQVKTVCPLCNVAV